ncbi:hypothetical protein [Nocardia cyriacigeorgica]|nr:hypothetical protein [Nocardia cyriacigeorgica]
MSRETRSQRTIIASAGGYGTNSVNYPNYGLTPYGRARLGRGGS